MWNFIPGVRQPAAKAKAMPKAKGRPPLPRHEAPFELPEPRPRRKPSDDLKVLTEKVEALEAKFTGQAESDAVSQLRQLLQEKEAQIQMLQACGSAAGSDNAQEAGVLQDLLDGSECNTPEKQAAIGQLAGEMSVVSPESKVCGHLGAQHGLFYFYFYFYFYGLLGAEHGQLGGQHGHMGGDYGKAGKQFGWLGGRPPGRPSGGKRQPRVERLSALLQPGKQEHKAATDRRPPPVEK